MYGVDLEIAPRRVVVEHKRGHVLVRHPKEMVRHVLVLRHNNVTHRVAAQTVNGVILVLVPQRVVVVCNHVHVRVQHNLVREQTVWGLRGSLVTRRTVRDPSTEDGACTPNAAKVAVMAREHVSVIVPHHQTVVTTV